MLLTMLTLYVLFAADLGPRGCVRTYGPKDAFVRMLLVAAPHPETAPSPPTSPTRE